MIYYVDFCRHASVTKAFLAFTTAEKGIRVGWRGDPADLLEGPQMCVDPKVAVLLQQPEQVVLAIFELDVACAHAGVHVRDTTLYAFRDL